MKNLMKLMVLFTIVPALFLSSCKQSEEEANEYLTLTTYMADNGMDLGKIITNDAGAKFVIAAKEGTELADKYVIDIRSAADFAAGHIEGAVNTPFADILAAGAAAEEAGKSAVVVCYTGQTACYATSLLRMAGYSSAQALKWGMSGWSEETDKWTANVADIAKDHENWSSDAAPALAAFASPLVVTGGTDGAAVLQARIEAVIAEGFKGVASADVLAAPGDYYINNFFSEADYLAFGHIKGANRILPLSLSNCENLDPDAKVVTYCYTGQTSAVITAYLRVIGFDAYSLKFGMNGLYNSNSAWVSNQWGGDSGSKHFPLAQ